MLTYMCNKVFFLWKVALGVSLSLTCYILRTRIRILLYCILRTFRQVLTFEMVV